MEFLEWITPSSLTSLPTYTSTLSVFLNEKGGIIDDTVITKHADDSFYVVTNAGRRDRDITWFKEKLNEWNLTERGREGPVEMETLDGWGLVALQGLFSHERHWQVPRIVPPCLVSSFHYALWATFSPVLYIGVNTVVRLLRIMFHPLTYRCRSPSCVILAKPDVF